MIELRLIPRLSQSGQPDTHICLTDGKLETTGADEIESVLYNFGSIHNGGPGKLVQFANAIQRMLLAGTASGIEDGIVDARSYGTVYLIGQLLAKVGVRLNQPFMKRQAPESALDYMPELLAALLDPATNSESSLAGINRSFASEANRDLTAYQIRLMLTTLAQDRSYRSFEDIDESIVSTRLRNILESWLGRDWPTLRTLGDSGGKAICLGLAKIIMHHVEHLTGSEWNAVCTHLRELRLARVEMHGRTLFMTTRPTATQLSLFYRLGVEPPPALLMQQEDDKAVIPSSNQNFASDFDCCLLQEQTGMENYYEPSIHTAIPAEM